MLHVVNRFTTSLHDSCRNVACLTEVAVGDRGPRSGKLFYDFNWSASALLTCQSQGRQLVPPGYNQCPCSVVQPRRAKPEPRDSLVARGQQVGLRISTAMRCRQRPTHRPHPTARPANSRPANPRGNAAHPRADAAHPRGDVVASRPHPADTG